MRRAIVPLTLALIALLAPAAAHARATVGIADQKSDMFSDARFQKLGIRQVRLAVAWDAMSSGWQIQQLDQYLALAKAEGVDVLVTWAPSRLAGRRTRWPTPAQFVTQFKRFRARYPWVTTFSTWNEANYNGFGPWDKPQLAARWWLALRAACTSCTVLGADLLDYPNMISWTKAFLKAAKGKQPKAWGLHDYVSINRRQTYPISDLLATVKGAVWLTETGGVVARRNTSATKLPQGFEHAATVTNLLLTKVAAMPRVARIYIYQWNSTSAKDSWDSALISWAGTPRPAFAQLTAHLPPKRAPLPVLVPAAVPAVLAPIIQALPPLPPLPTSR